MGGDDDAETFGKFESLVHLAIIHTEKVFVGEKYFEGCGAIGDDVAELRFRFVDEFGDGHVESVIAGAVALGFGFPELVTFESVVIAIGAAHFNVGGGAADESGDAGGFVGVLGERGHEREIDVDVGIDEAGENQFASGVDGFGAGGGFEVFADTGDGFVFDVDVGGVNGSPTVTISPFRISSGIMSLPGRGTDLLVDVDAHFFAVFFHFFPVFGYFGLGRVI